jgi:hypothetical protein
MRDQRGKHKGLLAVVVLAAALLMNCAAPITHPVQLAYNGHVPPVADETVAVGIQTFRDQRDTEDRFVIGYRQLGHGERERYASSPEDIARAVTRMTRELVRQKGGVPGELEGWNYAPDQMMELTDAFDVMVGGDIVRLRCNAEKRLMHTRMDLELEIVVYVGKVREGVVHRRPISMRTERVAATFGPRELQQFLNDMLSQALEKGCADIP